MAAWKTRGLTFITRHSRSIGKAPRCSSTKLNPTAKSFLLACTRLLREWDGTEHSVTVLRDGFDWQGRKFKSLSAVARAITGTQWNSYRFFGLREAGRDPR